MAQGNRPERVGEEIRRELAILISREVHDPGVGFVTLTHTKVSPDLQLVRVYYTTVGDERGRRETQRALDRATPFLRRQVGERVRLRRVPELRFEFDRGVEHQARVESLLIDIEEERRIHPIVEDEHPEGDADAQATEPKRGDGDPL